MIIYLYCAAETVDVTVRKDRSYCIFKDNRNAL